MLTNRINLQLRLKAKRRVICFREFFDSHDRFATNNFDSCLPQDCASSHPLVTEALLFTHCLYFRQA